MKNLITGLCMVLALVPTAAMAGEVRLQPVEGDNAEVRYVQGVPTVSQRDETGGVMVTQTDPIYGRMRLRVAYTNASGEPINFGAENVTATIDGNPVKVMTSQELEKIAKNKAGWAMFAVAMVGGLGAVAAANNANRTYTTYGSTPYGNYISRTVVHDPAAAALGTAVAAGTTAYAISEIDSTLEKTLGAIRDNVIQTTTIDHGASYGGLLVLDKYKLNKKAPGRLVLTFKRSASDEAGYQVAFDMKR